MGVSDDEAQAAKDKLHAAIREYYEAVDPDAYVSAWSLVTHKLSPEMETEGTSAVGHVEPTGQAWPLTVGILRIAANDAESPWGGKTMSDIRDVARAARTDVGYECESCGRPYASLSAAETCSDIDTGHAWEND